MDEYTEREAAITALLNDAPEQVGYSREDAADCIRYMDAADVALVRHGRWKCNKPCPVCGEDRFKGLDADIWADWEPPYCPKPDALAAEREYIKQLCPVENIAPGQGYPDSLAIGREIAHAKQSKAVYCPELEQTFVSVNEAARQTGANRNKVKECCQGGRNTTHGFHFQYAG